MYSLARIIPTVPLQDNDLSKIDYKIASRFLLLPQKSVSKAWDAGRVYPPGVAGVNIVGYSSQLQKLRTLFAASMLRKIIVCRRDRVFDIEAVLPYRTGAGSFGDPLYRLRVVEARSKLSVCTLAPDTVCCTPPMSMFNARPNQLFVGLVGLYIVCGAFSVYSIRIILHRAIRSTLDQIIELYSLLFHWIRYVYKLNV